MAIQKKYLKNKQVAKVTLSLPVKAVPEAKDVKVVGDFTDWNEGLPMKKTKTDFKVTVDLPINNSYQFRYLIDGQRWENDREADAYINNGVSSEDNSVVVL